MPAKSNGADRHLADTSQGADGGPSASPSPRPPSGLWENEARARSHFCTDTFNGLRRRARNLARLNRAKSYDDELEQRREGDEAPANGIRVWYDSFTTIDWVHDAIKETSRRRRIQSVKGLRGLAANAWDRFQGWLIVVVTGLVTAVIAGGIIESEAVLFDLKDGYCSTGWWQAKRFCCPFGGDQDWDRDPSFTLSSLSSRNIDRWTWATVVYGRKGSAPQTSRALSSLFHTAPSGWFDSTSGSLRWATVSQTHKEAENCPGWVKWSDRLQPVLGERRLRDVFVYLAVAILWALIASILTLYLTSSELYISKRKPSPREDEERTDRTIDAASSSSNTTFLDITATAATVSERTPLLSTGVTQQSHYSSTPRRTLLPFPPKDRIL